VPLMPLRIFQTKTLAGANAVGVLLGGGFFAYILIGTIYMQQVLGYSALKAGVAFLPFPVGVIVSSAIASRTMPIFVRGSSPRQVSSSVLSACCG